MLHVHCVLEEARILNPMIVEASYSCNLDNELYMLWFNYFILCSNILFSFVSNSLAYITIPQNKGK